MSMYRHLLIIGVHLCTGNRGGTDPLCGNAAQIGPEFRDVRNDSARSCR